LVHSDLMSNESSDDESSYKSDESDLLSSWWYDACNCSKPGYISIAYSKIANIPYNQIFTTKFNDSSIFNYDYFMGLFKLVACECTHDIYINIKI
jgi:hypothetical protein